jgi:hypothetical protein
MCEFADGRMCEFVDVRMERTIVDGPLTIEENGNVRACGCADGKEIIVDEA